MSKRENLPMWIYGTLLVESEAMNRKDRGISGMGVLILLCTLAWLGVVATFGGCV